MLATELAERIRDMGDKELGVLKAVMDEVGFDTLDGVIELAGRTSTSSSPASGASSRRRRPS